jgi:hypothetical protein
MASTQPNPPERFAAALGYVARGWPVFPCAPGEKRPATAHGLKDATTDTEQIRAWWTRWPDVNIGLVTGHGFDVLDVDSDAGFDEFERLVGGDDVVIDGGGAVNTPGGGAHFYFRASGLGNRARFRPNLDWRGRGGYVIAPPSVRADGRRWKWCLPWGADTELAPAPGWLLDLVGRSATREQTARTASCPPRRTGSYARTALEGELRAVASAPVGSRNDALVRASFSLGQLVGAALLDAADVSARLLGAALQAALDEREARATILSGLEAGVARPREVA